MKKTLLFVFMFSFLLLQKGFSQNVQWGNTFESPTSNSIFEYIGSDGETDFYCFDYYNLNGKKFDDINFAAVKNGEIVNVAKKTDIRKGSLEKVYFDGNEIKVIYSYYNKDIEEYEVICRSVDKTSLTTKNEKVLLTYQSSKRNVNYIYLKQSNDKSKMMIGYMDVDKKTNIGFIDVTVFDNDLKKLWRKQYSPKVDGEISLQDFLLSNKGELTVVATNQVMERKKAIQRRIIVAKIADDLFEEYKFTYDNEMEFRSMQAVVLDKDRIAIGAIDNPQFSLVTFVLNIDEERIETTQTTPLDKKYAWTVSEIAKLSNGNFVVVCENRYTMEIVSKGPTVYDRNNANIRVVCINPEQKSPLFNQLISRATSVASYINYSTWDFEKPAYFVDGNNFYVLYNTSKKVVDFSGKPMKKAKTKFKRKNADVETRMITFDGTGKTEIKTIFTEKESGGKYSPFVNEKTGNTQIRIARIAKNKEVTLGILNLK